MKIIEETRTFLPFINLLGLAIWVLWAGMRGYLSKQYVYIYAIAPLCGAASSFLLFFNDAVSNFFLENDLTSIAAYILYYFFSMLFTYWKWKQNGWKFLNEAFFLTAVYIFMMYYLVVIVLIGIIVTIIGGC